jgi:Pectate lyase superfamily protein
MTPQQDPSLRLYKTLDQKGIVVFIGRKPGMILRTALLSAWLGSTLSFGAAAQTIAIGETAVLTAADSGNGDLLVAQEASLSQPATIQSLSFYVTAAAGQLVLGIYNANGPSGGPGTLVAQTAAFTPKVGWNVAATTTTPTLAAGNYWLAYLPSDGGLAFVKENNSGNCHYYSLEFTSTLPPTFSTRTRNCTPTTWSFYATLAASSVVSAAVNGQCGAANGTKVSSAPATNLCSAGTASAVSGSGPWSWSCAGSNGGTTASCSASLDPAAVNGSCGAANGKAVSTAPSAGLCTSGTASAVTGSGPWNWSCAGSSGGTTASCSAPYTPAPTNGQCGAANGVAVSAAPTIGLCSVGLASSVTGTGPWNWSCAGSNGGTTASCQAPTQGSGPIPPANNVSANWQMAGMLSVGGIPNRTTVCATVSPIGSGGDDTANIQNAINACPAGEVVNLAAGTFTVTEGNFVLLNKGITLRGAGPGSTIIQRTNGCPPLSPSSNGNCGSNPSPFIIVGPEQYNNWVTSTNLTADVAQGATSVQVTSASGFSVGQIVLLDEMSNAAYQPDVGVGGSSQIWAASDYRVVWQKHNPSQGYDDFSSSQYPYQANTAGCWFNTPEAPSGTQRCDRATSELKRISAISGNTITFDSPVMISYRVAHTAQLSYFQMAFTANAGVESMTLSGADNQALEFMNAANSWAYKVECTQWLGHGCIAADSSFRVQIEQFYVHDGAWPEPGGGGYALEMCCGSSEILIENGISLRTDKVIVSLGAGAGSVVAYNYMDQAFICCDSSNPAEGSDGWIENGLNNAHYPGSHHALFEGNWTHQMGEDETHGNSTYNTYFRNYSTGYRTPAWVNAYDKATINDLTGTPQGTPGPLSPAETQLYTYWEAFIGNVLGYPGYSTSANGWVYEDATGGPAIFVLGVGYTSGNNGPDPMAGFDTSPPGTTVAHGNYDYLTNSVHWDPNISTQTLPNSLYLSSEPSFFTAGSGYTWPWVNPTGTPQLYTLPAQARYNAWTPFTQP